MQDDSSVKHCISCGKPLSSDVHGNTRRCGDCQTKHETEKSKRWVKTHQKKDIPTPQTTENATTMNEIERYQHLLHAKTSGFQRKVERARDIINESREIGQLNWYCAFSGGVDSTVLLDLLFEQQRISDKAVLWGDDGWDYPETLQFLKATEERYFFRLKRIRSMQPWHDWCTEMSRPDLADDPAALAAWGNPRRWDGTWHTLTRDAGAYGYDGVFMGLLASESRKRAYALHDGRKPLYQVKGEGGMWHCSPLAHFTKRDIWAYVTSHELPYNPVYDRLAELDVPLERRRVAPLTCFAVQQYGSVVTLKRGWPELYLRLASTFERVREYV